jgi:cytochrome b561
MNKPSEQRYSPTAIAIHWLHAVLIIGLLVLGYIMVDLPKGPQRTNLIALHKSLGFCAILLFMLRLGWRYHRPPPPSLSSGWQHLLAEATHHLLYLLLAVVPLAGYVSSSFSKFPLKFFGWPVFKAGWPDDGIHDLLGPLHQYSAYLLAGLLVLHVAGALYHAVLRDGTLSRMLPGGQA